MTFKFLLLAIIATTVAAPVFIGREVRVEIISPQNRIYMTDAEFRKTPYFALGLCFGECDKITCDDLTKDVKRCYHNRGECADDCIYNLTYKPSFMRDVQTLEEAEFGTP